MVQAAKPNALDFNRLLSAGQLPALPQSAIRLIQLSQNPDNGPSEFAVPIEADPGLTIQVLRFVNSSYFGLSRKISSVKLAITLVGVRTIKNFSLWSAVFSLMPNPRCGPFDLQRLWQDSLRRAVFARLAARQLDAKTGDDAFAAALLQDMAVPLLAKELPAEYARLLVERSNGQARLSDLEREQFGWTHAEAAGQMARLWKLPESTAHLVERHTSIDELAAASSAPAAEVAVALSALLPAGTDASWPEFAQFETHVQKLLPASVPAMPQMLADVDKEFAEFAPVLKIGTPTRALVEYYQEALATCS